MRLTAVFLLLSLACATQPDVQGAKRRGVAHPGTSPFLAELQERTFRWFRDTTSTSNGLVPDRWPTPAFSSVAAVGFGLTAWGIGAERGYITR